MCKVNWRELIQSKTVCVPEIVVFSAGMEVMWTFNIYMYLHWYSCFFLVSQKHINEPFEYGRHIKAGLLHSCVSLSRYEVTIMQKFGPLDYWAFGFKGIQWSKNKNVFENCLLAFIILAFMTNALLWRSATTSDTYPPTERNGGHEMVVQMLINFHLYNFRSHHPLWDIFTKLLQNQKLHFELNNFSNEHLCCLWKPKR